MKKEKVHKTKASKRITSPKVEGVYRASSNNLLNISIPLIESAIEWGGDHPGPELDAIAIAMSKKFRCVKPMRVGCVSSFAKKFGTSPKRIKQALQSITGRSILDYDEKRGILTVRATAGIGYNIPFVVIQDEVYDDSRRRINKCVIEHHRNVDVRIPVKESEKGSLKYLRERLRLGIMSNHLIKSVRTYNDWKRQRTFTNNSSRKSSTSDGLYEGVSVDMLAKINNISKRTCERLLVKLQSLDLFKSVTRTELVGEYRSRYEAEAAIAAIHAKGDWGAYFVAGHSVMRRVSNRYEIKHTKKNPRFRKIIDPKKQEWKNSKRGNWDKPVVERYKNLVELYNLEGKKGRTEDFCIADVNIHYERQTNILETNRKNVRALVKDNNDKEVEYKKAEIGISSVEEYEKKVEPAKKQKAKSAQYQDWLYEATGGSSVKLQQLGQYLQDQNKAMGERLGLDLDKCEHLTRRDKTYQRFEAYKRAYFKAMKEEEKSTGRKLYFNQKHVMRLFNETDKEIKDEFPLTMWEYAYTYSGRKKYIVSKARMQEFKAEAAAARLEESKRKALELAIRRQERATRMKAVQKGDKILRDMRSKIVAQYKAISDAAILLCQALAPTAALLWANPSTAKEGRSEASTAISNNGNPVNRDRPCNSSNGSPTAVSKSTNVNKSSITNNRGNCKLVEDYKNSTYKETTITRKGSNEMTRQAEEDTYFDLLYSIYLEDQQKVVK